MVARTDFQEKLKLYSALEKKVRRLLLKDENEEAVNVLLEIIEGYKSIGLVEKAKVFEEELKNFAMATNIKLDESFGSSERTEDAEKILGFIESIEKKVKRRILQGKTQDAIKDLKYIISELRNLQHLEKAELLESLMNQFIAELSGMPSETAPSTTPSLGEPEIPSSIPVASNRPPSPAPAASVQPVVPSFKPYGSPIQPPENSRAEQAPLISDLLSGSRPASLVQGPPMPRPPSAQPLKTPVALPAQSSKPIAAPPKALKTPVTPPAQYPKPLAIPIPPPKAPPEQDEESTELMPSDAKSTSTIKDEPYSEEELLLKKLFEIKGMLGGKNKE